jgi:hypothetical protein
MYSELVQDFVSGLAGCVNKPHHNSSLSRLVVKARSDWLQLPLASLHINRHVWPSSDAKGEDE